MRRLITAALTATMALTPLAALAQDNPREARREYRDEVRDANRDYRKDLRNADSARDVRDANRERRGEIRDARRDYRNDTRDWRGYRNYDWNRPGRGGSYYADQYYRDGRYYQPRRLSRNDRIYRGSNGRYYCRRSDGTTGLIIGAAAGGLLGNSLSNGRSSTLATLLGAGAGAALGSSIDRGQVQCR
jgi:Ni/Co efflux regulator RcnB